MYLEIDEGYQDHRKTVHLCGLMMNPEAEVYPIRLWRWAVRSCPDGNLRTMTPYAVETILRYRLMDGKLYAAMVDAGFIDDLPDGTKQIHNWMKRTGGALRRMAKKAQDLQQRRLHANKPRKCDPKLCPICTGTEPARASDSAGSVPAESPHSDGDDPPRPDQSRPDKTRPVQRDPDARDPVPPSTPPAPDAARARSGYEWWFSYSLAWRDKYQRHYGNGSSDAKAQGDLTSILDGMPDAEALALWATRDEMFRQYLASTDAKLVTSRHPFSLLVSRWCDFRGDLPAPKTAAASGGPPRIEPRPETPPEKRITDAQRDEILREKWPEMHAKVQAIKARQEASARAAAEKAAGGTA